MELFKTPTLRQEYKEMVNDILPKILNCNYCNVSLCKCHQTFNMSCNQCRQLRCRSCHASNISRKILLDASTDEVRSYLNCFIVDFLNLSNESIKQYFPDIKTESLDRENFFFKKSYVKSEKNRFQVVNQTLPSDIRQVQFQNGKRKRRVFHKI